MNTATHDAANQQLTFGNKSATFDANGNLATLTDPSGTTTYTWNARNQLTALSGPNVTASFQYDALGRRKSKTINGTTTEFLYDGIEAVQELSSGTPVANLLTGAGIDEVLLRTDTAGARSFLADGLGSTLALTDPTGTVQTDYTYEPFGNTTTSGASSSNAFQYTGRENDGTGLYYYRARYYHPELQRFVSEDPIGLAGGDVNIYGYVLNRPVDLVDPNGLWPGWLGWLGRFLPRTPPPPAGYPKPPGWNPNWQWRYSERLDPRVSPRWFDPKGGEWRWHQPDKYHPKGHWDHNPWERWNNEWENIDPSCPPPLDFNPDDWFT